MSRMKLRLTQRRIQRLIRVGKEKSEFQNWHSTSHKIPSIIYITNSIMSDANKKQEQAPSTTNKFSQQELADLFTAMEEILPIGSDQWNQLAEVHANKYPGRGLGAIRRKYNSLARRKIPTGSPWCPPEVKWAKKIKWKLATKIELSHCQEDFDLEEGYPKEYVPPSVDPPAPTPTKCPPVPPAAAFAGVYAPAPIAVGGGAVAAAACPALVAPTVQSELTSNTTSNKRAYNRVDKVFDSMNVNMAKAFTTQKEDNEAMKKGIVSLQESIAVLITVLTGKRKRKKSNDESDCDSDWTDDTDTLIAKLPGKKKKNKKSPP